MLKVKLIVIIIICVTNNLFSQKINCDVIKKQTKQLNDSSLNEMFEGLKSSKFLLFGETHGNKHSEVYPIFIKKAISNGFNTIIIELPVSYNLLFEELLQGDKFNEKVAYLITRVVYNKKDFRKTLKTIYDLNLIRPIKIICPDLEHSLNASIDRIRDILNLHQNTLNAEFLQLEKTVNKMGNKSIISEGECANLFKEIIDLEDKGNFNDSKSLGIHYKLFKEIISATKLNGMITGKNYNSNDRELFMIKFLTNAFKNDTNMKAIGFFGSTHVQLKGDDVLGYFVKEPFAKLLNNTPIFKNSVNTVLLNYRCDKEVYKYFQNYLFSFDEKCFELLKLNPKKKYLYFINKNLEIESKLNNYNFILYL